MLLFSRMSDLVGRTLSQNELDEAKSPAAAGGDIFLIISSTLMLVLRIWSRLAAHRDKFWYDDYCAILAWVPGMFFCLIVLFQFEGLTIHPAIGQAAYAANASYYVGMGLIRTSVLCFYARVFGVKTGFKRALWIIGLVNGLYAIAFAFASSFYCIPARKVWEPKIHGHCASIEDIYFSATLLAVILDLIVLVMPMPLLMKLHASPQRKTGIAAIFLLGYSVPALSLIKLVYVGKEMTDPSDNRGSFETPLTLTSIEIPVSLISTSIPPIFSLCRHVRKFGPSSLLSSAASSERRAELLRKKTSYDDNSLGDSRSLSLAQPGFELQQFATASGKHTTHVGSTSQRSLSPERNNERIQEVN